MGATRKYLLYAIGEIALVVIGILIALQINNWNEERKDNIREQVILKQLKDEYKSNLVQLDEKIEMRANIVQSALSIMKYMDSPSLVRRDSLIIHLSNVIPDPTFDPIQNDLISSGNIRLIQNEKLKRRLSNWSSDVIALQEQEHLYQMHSTEIFRPTLDEIGITRDVMNALWENDKSPLWLLDQNSNSHLRIGISQHNVPLQDILKYKKLEGVIASAISYNHVGNLQSQTLKNRINEILDLLKSELDSTNWK